MSTWKALRWTAIVVLVFGAGQIIARSSESGPPTGVDGRAARLPAMVIRDIDGRNVDFRQLRGQVVVVNLWATWCPPCLFEIPAFVALQQKYADRGVRFVGISLDELEPSELRDFAREKGINYPVVQATPELLAAIPPFAGLPTTFFVDARGEIVHAAGGMLSHDEAERHVLEALAHGQQR